MHALDVNDKHNNHIISLYENLMVNKLTGSLSSILLPHNWWRAQ